MSLGQPIRVFLVDDHPIVRDGMKALLSESERMNIIGEAADGEESVRKVKRLSPDIVVMDIGLPKMNGLEATRVILEENPSTRIIILTIYDNKEYALQALRSGARGYLIKNAPSEELMEAIEIVHNGGLFFPEEVSQMVVQQLADQSETEERPELTRREGQVLGLIAEGLSNRDIASRLSVSVRTVETHREHVMRKLDIHSVAGLTKYAIHQGLTPIE